MYPYYGYYPSYYPPYYPPYYPSYYYPPYYGGGLPFLEGFLLGGLLF